MPTNLTGLSNEELMQGYSQAKGQMPVASGAPSQEQSMVSTTGATNDLASMSNLELLKAYGNKKEVSARDLLTKDLKQGGRPVTNFWQDLMLSFAVNDDARAVYLAQEFPNSQVTFEQGQLMVDGKRVNPKGYDVGDLGRNAGYSFNLGGQIAYSLLGIAAGGSVAGPAGAVAGGFTGGTAGAAIGEGIRIAIGEILGLDAEEEAVLDRLRDEALLGAQGEALGLGVAGTGAVIGKSPIGKGVGKLWTKTINKLKEHGFPLEDTLMFTSNISEDVTKLGRKEGFDKIMKAVDDPNMMNKIVNTTLFGKQYANVSTNELLRTGKSGLTVGQEAIIKSINQMDSQAYDDLLKVLKIADDEALTVIRNSDTRAMLKPENVGMRGYLNLAQDIKDSLNSRRVELGKELEKAIRKAPVRVYDFDETAVFAQKLLGKEFNKMVRLEGYEDKILPAIRGEKELQQLMNTFFGKRVKDIKDPFGNVVFEIPSGGRVQPLGFVKKNDMLKINNSIDKQIDAIMSKKDMPSEIRNAARQIRQHFKQSLYKQLGDPAEVQRFSSFAKLNDDIVDRGVKAVANDIRSNSLTGEFGEGILRDALNGMKTATGKRLVSRMDRINAVERIARKSAADIQKDFFARISHRGILSEVLDDPLELAYRNISSELSANPKTAHRAFMGDAKLAIAADDFRDKRVNMLRTQALIGLSGLGFITGALGPIGSVGILAASVALTPKNVGRLLAKLERMTPSVKRKLAEKVAKAKAIGGTAGRKDVQAILRGLLSRSMGSGN